MTSILVNLMERKRAKRKTKKRCNFLGYLFYLLDQHIHVLRQTRLGTGGLFIIIRGIWSSAGLPSRFSFVWWISVHLSEYLRVMSFGGSLRWRDCIKGLRCFFFSFFFLFVFFSYVFGTQIFFNSRVVMVMICTLVSYLCL